MIGSLTLDQLRVLVAIVETGSFSAAGRRLGRVQSAISQAIATLEATQGVALFDRSGHRPMITAVGRALLVEARSVLASAARFESLAAGVREGLEPELAIAIDPLVPTQAFIGALAALRAEFPYLPVSFSTEGLRGAERSLRRGDAALAFCTLLPSVPEDVVALPLAAVQLIPVVAPSHPLATFERATPADLEGHIQLVLSDPDDPGGPSYGVIGVRTWRFVDLARRMDFLLAGLGWCRMPEPLVEPLIAARRLSRLVIEDDPTPPAGAVMIYAAHMRARPLGRAGGWLLEQLQVRLGGVNALS